MITPDSEGAVRMSGRRVLVVTPFVPSCTSAHGASAAMLGVVGTLAGGNDVALLCLRGLDEPHVDAELTDQLAWHREVARPPTRHRVRDVVRLAVKLVRGQPMWVQHWWSREMSEQILASVEQWRPDVVHFEMSVMTPYLCALADTQSTAKLVLTVYDPSGPAAQVELVKHSGLRWLAHALDIRAWRITDLAAARAADAVVLFTEDDAATQAPWLGATPSFVIPLGVRIPDVALSPLGTEPDTALFVGSGLHPPNIDAVDWLGHLLPQLRTAVPEARVVVVGDFRGVEPHDHLDVRGRVPDVAVEMDRAALVVAPLRLGGGMRVKVLEALAAGKAVVATSKALAGLTAARDGAAVCADDAQTFVGAVARLLRDDGARRTLGENARVWAQANLSWSSRLPLYEAMYAQIGASAGQSGPVSRSVPRATS